MEDNEDDQEEHGASDIVAAKLKDIVDAVREKGETTNAHLNLCWTGPVDNTPMQAKIAYGKVANVAVDLYCDASRAKLNTMQPATKPAPTDAGQEGASCPQPSRSVYEDILGQENLPWRIPTCVEKGFEIPICVTNAFAVPELGKFKRLGMDVVVNATWLA